MNKKTLIAMLIISIMLNIAFGALYYNANNHKEYRENLTISYTQAKNNFEKYVGVDEEKVEVYNYAVANLNTADQMLALLKSENQKYLNDLHWVFLFEPQIAEKYIPEIITALEELIIDYKDQNAYTTIENILDEIRHELIGCCAG